MKEAAPSGVFQPLLAHWFWFHGAKTQCPVSKLTRESIIKKVEPLADNFSGG